MSGDACVLGTIVKPEPERGPLVPCPTSQQNGVLVGDDAAEVRIHLVVPVGDVVRRLLCYSGPTSDTGLWLCDRFVARSPELPCPVRVGLGRTDRSDDPEDADEKPQEEEAPLALQCRNHTREQSER